MRAILRKEINAFFSSPVGYLVVGLFLVANGLFLWVIPGEYNILDSGFADLSPFFELSPWILMFLIPAISMRLFSEEFKLGTIEILQTKPMTSIQIVLGKYFAAVILILISLLPSLIYLYSIGQLGTTINNFDTGVVIGSYIGLLFLVLSYAAIGVFASTISNNQIIAFLIGVCISFVLYFGFGLIASMSTELLFIEGFGMQEHFKSISRGILDTRNILYFVCISLFFIIATSYKLERK